ncbi:MAG TPA: hypothetical protein VM940_04060 [Chthoniobacterales bacterium]|nr:hypothetical protein [Chthoniobacterales bacterium]
MTTDIILIVMAGLVSAAFGAFSTFSPGFARRYVKNNPQGYFWREWLGRDRAVVVVRRVLGPLGMILGIAILYFAVTLMRSSG